MAATNALVRTWNPLKMNHPSYGNAEAHVHWHLFPRYDTLPDHRNNPWLHAAEFAGHVIDPDTMRRPSGRVRANLTRPPDLAGSL